MKKLRIFIGLPAYGGKLSFEHAWMWLTFGAVINESSERFMLVGRQLVDVCGVDKARNICVDAARKADADWLLMVDSDTWVDDGGDLLQMISDADKASATIVGAAVPRRSLSNDIEGVPELMAYTMVAPRDVAVSLTPAGLLDLRKNLEPGFAKVDAMATACIAINMRHVEFMDQPFFRFTERESEDLDFCRRVREMRGGYMLLYDGKVDPAGERVDWEGLILIDKRITAFHLNRPSVLKGL